MNQAPKFTVVIPSYNRADLLPEAVKSVLNQTFQDFEVIVVDNCSTDNTQEVMKQFDGNAKVKYIRNEQNMERAYSRNVGFKNARGKFLTLLDSDDVIYPDCLADAAAFAAANPDKKIFHNLYQMIDDQGRPAGARPLPPIVNQHKQICQGNFLSCIGVFLHREVYTRFFFTEDLKMIGSEDYEIWFRVLAHYEVGRINKVNCGIREHVGRSVYSKMYENLEYQRQQLTGMIASDAVLREKYTPYIGYVNANYYFHRAMYSLHKTERMQALQEFTLALTKGQGMFLSKRFFAFIKNFVLSPLKRNN
jgi:glycosyltransferase involved in cell wall biosynthesis